MADSITIQEYWYLMNRIAYWLIKNNKKFNTRSLYGYFDRVADYGTVVKAIKDRGTKYQSDALVAEFTECAIHDNKDLSFLPAYVTGSNNVKYYTDSFVSMANRVSSYEVLNGKSPLIVYIKKENTVSTNTPTLDLFEKYFGQCKTIDDALAKIRGRGYAYYYNSQYNTATTIERIYNKKGVNCTDSAQLFYRLAYDMNNKYGTKYECQFVHVFCQSGTGHIRLRFKRGNESWWYRDPSAVLDGNSITYNWCSNGRVNAYNPSWIFSDLYQ